MEYKTLRVKPSQIDSMVQVLSNFGWSLKKTVFIYDKKLDMDIYTPKHFKKRYSGKIAHLTFQRNDKRKDYQKLVEVEKEYVSYQLDTVKEPKSTLFLLGLTGVISSLILALMTIALAFVVGLITKLIVRNGFENLPGLTQFYNGAVNVFASFGLTKPFFNLFLKIFNYDINDIMIATGDSSNVSNITTIVASVSGGLMAITLLLVNLFLVLPPGLIFLILGTIIIIVRFIIFANAKRSNRKINIERAKVLAKLID